MLEDLGKDLANIAMAGVGAVAILTEKAVEVGKVCAEKGAETLEKGKAASEELRRKGEQVAAERREKARQEYLESLDAAGREELRRKLAELDAKEAAEQAQRLLEGNPDNGDGTFTIQESGYYTDITAPEGYVLDYVNYDEVDFYNEELDRKVCYQMWTTADSNDFLFWDLVNEQETLYCGDADGTGQI